MKQPPTPGCEALRQAILRIEELVAGETACLKRSLAPDLAAFNDKKARMLLQFDRTLRMVDPAEARAHLSAELGMLRERLEDNRKLLAIHAEAARRVTELVAEAMIAGESDGTYARYPQRVLARS